jgi:hypothetical protein
MGRVARKNNTETKGQFAFYLIEPRDNSDADRFARKLIASKHVKEVYVTEGAYGFIVKARVGKDENGGPIPAGLLGNPCRRVGLAISRYSYVK